MHVVPGPLPEAVTGIDDLPGLAAVVGAIETAIRVVRFDEGVDAIRVGSYGDADASVGAFRQTVLFEALPGCASIARMVKSAARATIGETP